MQITMTIRDRYQMFLITRYMYMFKDICNSIAALPEIEYTDNNKFIMT